MKSHILGKLRVTGSSDQLIQKLQKSGIKNPEILDCINRIIDIQPTISIKEVYPEAKSVQLLKPPKPGKVLVMGNHTPILYLLLGKISTFVYIIQDTFTTAESIVNNLKECGYGNVRPGFKETLDEQAPYQNIIVDITRDMEPLDLIKLLLVNGTMLIKKVKPENDVVKITKTSSGYFRENYDPNIFILSSP